MELRDSHEWMLWRAREAIGETHQCFVVPIAEVIPVVVKPKRKKHWGGPFQRRFSFWLSGDGERPCDLGYTRRQLMRHLERQFSKGMSWDNYAGGKDFKRRDVWVVDHIVPKYLFDADDVLHAYALSNLRPLWMPANMAKGTQREHLL